MISPIQLSVRSVSDEQFFAATEYLATRFDRRSASRDLRIDEDAPGILYDWFRHAFARIPAFAVWDLSCQVEDFFDPHLWLYLPGAPGWDRWEILSLSNKLRAQEAWRGAFVNALENPSAASIRALSCCGINRQETDPFPVLWKYLKEHANDGYIWHLMGPEINAERLSTYLALARSVLLPKVPWRMTEANRVLQRKKKLAVFGMRFSGFWRGSLARGLTSLNLPCGMKRPALDTWHSTY